MGINEKPLFKKIINNIDLIYLAITVISILVSLFFSYKMSLAIGSYLGVIGLFLIPLTVGAKIAGFSPDERADQILSKSVSAAFPITMLATLTLGELWRLGIVHSGYDLTSIIVVVGFISQNAFICIYKRLL